MKYEDVVRAEIALWERRLVQPPGWLEKASKNINARINHLIPGKVHQLITGTVKTIVRTALFGAEYSPKRNVQVFTSLEDADKEAKKTVSLYQKIATAEGAGTGAGGILFSAVDFPALIAIKMKLLFEMAHIYGFSSKHFSERIFILNLFRLTFSGNDQRRKLLMTIKSWETEQEKWSSDSDYYKHMDWDTFQKEYRDAIDFRKMLQMVPGIGAAAGAWANYTILQELGETAMNAYRLRRIKNDIF